MSELKASWIPEGWKVERGSKDYREIVITAPDGEQAVLDAELDKLANQLLHIALNAADSRDMPFTHEMADAFWECWKINGETHKHGYYESTWMSIRAALSRLEAEK